MSLPTFWLSFHVPYACRHSGVCCSSGWDIDVEHARLGAIATAVAQRRLAAPAPWYQPVSGAPDDVAGVLALAESGRCVFQRDPGCAIHAALGHEALPSACQHFPRIALIDPRGVFVTLSHYCPTAASLLFDATCTRSTAETWRYGETRDGIRLTPAGLRPARIVEGPPVLASGLIPEGLDARDALPPLDTPRRLMDLEKYGEWERGAVELLTAADRPAAAIDALDPEAPAVSDHALFDIACEAITSPHRWPPFVPASDEGWGGYEPVVGRYLAAHAFAAWTAYQGNGLRCTVLYLRLVLAVLKTECARGLALGEAIRHSDLLLRHLADRQLIADRLSAIAAR